MANKKGEKNSSSSLYVLLGILGVLGIAAVIEYRARLSAQNCYNRLAESMPSDDALPTSRHSFHTITSAEVHELIGIEPAEVSNPPTGMRETYVWTGIRKHTLYVYYQPGKPARLHHVELNAPVAED